MREYHEEVPKKHENNNNVLKLSAKKESNPKSIILDREAVADFDQFIWGGSILNFPTNEVRKFASYVFSGNKRMRPKCKNKREINFIGLKIN